MRRPTAIAVIACALAATGCGGSGGEHRNASQGKESAVTPSGKHVNLKTPGAAKGEQRVRLKVVTTQGRNTVALVPVYIEGHGPFPFALDTGASQTLIDSTLARQLHLHVAGARPVRGIAGGGTGTVVSIRNWRAGHVGLPAERIASFRLLRPGGLGPAGLLGSDILSRYGKIAVDFDHDLLLLDPHVK